MLWKVFRLASSVAVRVAELTDAHGALTIHGPLVYLLGSVVAPSNALKLNCAARSVRLRRSPVSGVRSHPLLSHRRKGGQRANLARQLSTGQYLEWRMVARSWKELHRIHTPRPTHGHSYGSSSRRIRYIQSSVVC